LEVSFAVVIRSNFILFSAPLFLRGLFFPTEPREGLNLLVPGHL